VLVLGGALLGASVCAAGTLDQKVWNRGAADCTSNHDPALEVFEFNRNTYILRQNKCIDYEAPFIYVLFGERTVFVQDTGATPEPEKLPVYATILELVEQHQPATGEPLRWLITHSHSHGDHKAGDAQFRGRPQVTLVEPTAEGVRGYFGFKNWPSGEARIDLGGRELEVLPIPGHQAESLAVYDTQTGWLLTGDTVYPGRLYVFDWDAYRASVHRLAEFTRTHRVAAVVGTHIEMSKTAGRDYPMGSTFQPDEAPLPVTVQDLLDLDARLQQAGNSAQKITLPKFIVTPISWFERALSTVIGWFL
jgi:glyoxylase-like metal-dependent hydrolase (beta-lactamase superfamily II)